MADGKSTDKREHQGFFLALAAKGKDAWNAWRRDPANEDVRVTFAGIDFSEPPKDQIDFSGFEFGDKANFTGAAFGERHFSMPSSVTELPFRGVPSV